MNPKRGKRLRGAVRRARKRLAYARDHSPPARVKQAKRTVTYWEGLLRAYRKLIRRPYPHLSGDLDANVAVLHALENVAKHINRNIYVTSGRRTYAEQKRLWDNRFSNPYPVARPGTSRHETGRAADAVIGSQAIQNVVPAYVLRQYGLEPLIGDAVHVESH